ncbi:MAG TPA: hypothetical protein VHS59_00810 [Bacillota bacterium]|nr:hypothetical protein [Bacillota bacterium]
MRIRTSLYVMLLGLLMVFVNGCGDKAKDGSANVISSSDNPQYQSWLRADAREGFNKAIERDYRRLTVISGSLNRLNSSDHPEIELGKALGAIEASTFVTESEYTRLDNNINITPEMKKEFIPPGLLNVLYKNHKMMDHVYHDILKPYEELIKNKQQQTVAQEKVIFQTRAILMKVTEIFSRLTASGKDLSSTDAEGLVTQLDKAQSELMGIFYPIQQQVNVEKRTPLPIQAPSN